MSRDSLETRQVSRDSITDNDSQLLHSLRDVAIFSERELLSPVRLSSVCLTVCR